MKEISPSRSEELNFQAEKNIMATCYSLRLLNIVLQSWWKFMINNKIVEEFFDVENWKFWSNYFL